MYICIIKVVTKMKKFLRRTLGTLALLGTSFGAKAADNTNHIKDVNQNQIVQSKDDSIENQKGKKTNDVEKKLLFSLPTKKKRRENRRIMSLFRDVVKEAMSAIKHSVTIPFVNSDKGVEINLPSEGKTYKYRLTNLPQNYNEAEMKVYKKLINYILAARIKKLQDVNNDNKLPKKKKIKNKMKISYYQKINNEYINEHFSKKFVFNDKNKFPEISWLKQRNEVSGKEWLREVGGAFRESSYRSSRDFN